MHKTIHAMTLAALAATTLAASPAQGVIQTTDNKFISPSLCRPLTAPDATGLVFDTRGVVNSTTVDKRVICSILKDAESAYSSTADAYLYHYFKAGTIDGSVNCTYYLGPVGFNTSFSTFTANGSTTAGSNSVGGVHVDSYPASWNGAGTTAVCTLSGKMTLGFFELVEYASTNTP